MPSYTKDGRQIFGPTMETMMDYDVIPEGLHTVEIVSGKLQLSKGPTKDPTLVAFYGKDYHSHMLRLDLRVVANGDEHAVALGVCSPSRLLLEGKAWKHSRNALLQANLADVVELLERTFSGAPGDDTPLPQFQGPEKLWEQFSQLFLKGLMNDEAGNVFKSQCGHGLVNQTLRIEVGPPSEYEGEQRTGNIKYLPPNEADRDDAA